MKEQRQITKAEMAVMNILWDLAQESAGSAEVMARFTEPKPAMTTMLTHLKILTEKGFVKTEKHGKLLSFTPLITRDEYTRRFMSEVKDTFFGGSLTSLVSFFVRNEQLDEAQIAELMDIIRQERQL